MNDTPGPAIQHHPAKAYMAYMQGRSDIATFLGRLRPSKPLTETQVLGPFVALPGGTLKPINFSKLCL